MGQRKYSTNGFQLLNTLCSANGLQYGDAAAVNITKGQALFDNGSGFVTNVGTAFAATFLGISADDVDNSGGAAGDLKVGIIPPLPEQRFMVKNESATVAAQTDAGEIIDLESNDGVDVTDTTVTAWGFHVEEVDISSEAIAANAGGFVIGHFIKQ